MTDATASTAAGNPTTPTGQTTTSSGALAATAPTAAANVGTGAHSAMAAALVQNGAWTREQADKALADAGTAGEQPDPDQVSADNAMATALDNHNALADLSATLDSAGIDASEAGGVAYLVKAGLKRAPTPEQNAADAAEVMPMLEGIHGKEKAGWVMQWATREFDRMAASNPKLRDLAERSGAGNNVSLINALAAKGWSLHCAARTGKL
jgi:hypothetical protein